jgi:hypothetical protein
MHVRFTLLLCSFLAVTGSQAQQTFERWDDVQVSINNVPLPFPFAGGLNNPQFSAADLNNDGVQDMVIFDRAGDVTLTYLNNGTPDEVSYVFAPSFARFFPTLAQYALLRDYNQDGAADIFCASLAPGTQEVQVFQGFFQDDILQFKAVKFNYPGCSSCNPFLIYYPDEIPGFWNNLAITKEDLPDINDIDGDGDLDILTFEAFAGGKVLWYKNTSVEDGFGLDSLHFVLEDRCWGRFYESGLEACKNSLSGSPDTCAHLFWDPNAVDDRDGLHPGSTLLTFDQDKDGDMEIVLGDISFDCLNMMTNGGTPNGAWMNVQDTIFPAYNVPADVSSFPASFYIDVNNDGKKDLLVSPNNATSSEDQKNVWYYQNTGFARDTFDLQGRRLFTGDMVDFGSITQPTFADVNADGLMDIVVGGQFYSSAAASNARLHLLLNVGTATQPKFNIADSDFAGMSEFTQDYDFSPTFADMDSDGDLDLLVGSQGGGLYYYRNDAGPNAPMLLKFDPNPMWVAMDIGLSSVPSVLDLDSDGLLDIVLGERQGNVNFFKNIGSPGNPVFTNQPSIQKLGSVDTRLLGQSTGFSAPTTFLNEFGGISLVVGAQSGSFVLFENISPTPDSFPLTAKFLGNVDVGFRSRAAFADLNADGTLEMLCGNQRGGLTLYKTNLLGNGVSTTDVKGAAPTLVLSPNPARDRAHVQWSVQSEVTWRVFNALGQVQAAGKNPDGNFFLSMQGWPAGAYALDIQSGQLRTTRSIVVY